MLIWWLEGSKRLSKRVKKILKEAGPDKPLLVSDISLWEISMLHALGRIKLDRPLREWLEVATSPPLVYLQRITPAIATTIGDLPESFQRDPADRVLAATSIVTGATLVTADSRIRELKIIKTTE